MRIVGGTVNPKEHPTLKEEQREGHERKREGKSQKQRERTILTIVHR